ncbi:uncharacterized protein LOC109788665 isoform X2 [Cajanus cajan]|uniref:uncharacterized protein LOC109788665 isoform X1 n=1 Tax=Cajanus cajan TaxID=3821 RepID=UPI00098DABD1|nr:uncharacterized protein LOC109788665 isoform X1 [Cajanus cajan]XP_029125124.1 uncharacterized protein LOC109788665 isoform X2 [Cajanus cajan]
MEKKMDFRLEQVEKGLQDIQKRAVEESEWRRNIEGAMREMLEQLKEMRVTMGSNGREGDEIHGDPRAEKKGWMWRNLELPLFQGEDVLGWVGQMERYFRLKGVLEDEKVEVAMVAMQGKALTWFQWWEGRNPNSAWVGLKGALLRRFQPEMVQNPYEVLLGLKQEGSVADYREKFEANSGPLRIGDTNYLKGIFLNGLKEEIKGELRLHQLNSLEEIMDLALLIESRNSILRKEGGGSSATNNRGGWSKRNLR